MSTNKHKEKSRQKTHSMLCKNSPLGRLNFLMLSADADAKQFLKNKSDKCFFSKSMILQTIAVLFCKNYIYIYIYKRERETEREECTYSVGCCAIARTDFLWCVRVDIVFPAK